MKKQNKKTVQIFSEAILCPNAFSPTPNLRPHCSTGFCARLFGDALGSQDEEDKPPTKKPRPLQTLRPTVDGW